MQYFPDLSDSEDENENERGNPSPPVVVDDNLLEKRAHLLQCVQQHFDIATTFEFLGYGAHEHFMTRYPCQIFECCVCGITAGAARKFGIEIGPELHWHPIGGY